MTCLQTQAFADNYLLLNQKLQVVRQDKKMRGTFSIQIKWSRLVCNLELVIIEFGGELTPGTWISLQYLHQVQSNWLPFSFRVRNLGLLCKGNWTWKVPCTPFISFGISCLKDLRLGLFIRLITVFAILRGKVHMYGKTKRQIELSAINWYLWEKSPG